MFLDEFGELPLDLQSKLLRVLQAGELESVGEERICKVNVCIVAATNRNLKAETGAGKFRIHLNYCLNVFPIELPPLRKRKEDVAMLAEHLLGILSRRLGKQPPRLTQANRAEWVRHDWRSNIRELQHLLERALITSPKGKLHFKLNSGEITKATITSSTSIANEEILPASQLRSFESANIRHALQAYDGKVYGDNGAAALLGRPPTTLVLRSQSFEAWKVPDNFSKHGNHTDSSRAIGRQDYDWGKLPKDNWPAEYRT